MTTTNSYRFGAHQFLWKSHWTDNDLGIQTVFVEIEPKWKEATNN
jgi:hypothetical protein